MKRETSKYKIEEVIAAILPEQPFKPGDLYHLTENVNGAPDGMIFIGAPYGVFYGIYDAEQCKYPNSFGPILLRGKTHFVAGQRNYNVFKEYMDKLSWNAAGEYTLSEKAYNKLSIEDMEHAVEWEYHRMFKDNSRTVLTEANLWYQAPDFEISVKEPEHERQRIMAMYGLKANDNDPYTLYYEDFQEDEEEEFVPNQNGYNFEML